MGTNLDPTDVDVYGGRGLDRRFGWGGRFGHDLAGWPAGRSVVGNQRHVRSRLALDGWGIGRGVDMEVVVTCCRGRGSRRGLRWGRQVVGELQSSGRMPRGCRFFVMIFRQYSRCRGKPAGRRGSVLLRGRHKGCEGRRHVSRIGAGLVGGVACRADIFAGRRSAVAVGAGVGSPSWHLCRAVRLLHYGLDTLGRCAFVLGREKAGEAWLYEGGLASADLCHTGQEVAHVATICR